MEGRFADAQRALELATAEYFKAYTALHTRLRATSCEVDRLSVNKVSKECNKFLEYTCKELLNVRSALKAARDQERINRLPPELIKVFQFNIDVHTSRYLWGVSDLPQRRLLRIVSLSSVCSYWRKVAIETSSFWSNIPINLPETIVSLCVERANNRALDIVATEPSRGTTTSGKGWTGENALRAHAHNIHSLTISARTQARICSPMNWKLEPGIRWNLQKLSVHYTGNHRDWSSPGSRSILDSLPCIKLNTVTQGLRTLSLGGIRIDWYECAFTRLKKIKLRYFFLNPQELKQVLLTSPVLKVLELTHVGFKLDSRSQSRVKSEPLSPPNLRHLYLSDMELELENIVNMFGSGAYQVELNISLGLTDIMFLHPQPHRLRLRYIIPGIRNITVLGISDHLGPIQDAPFLSIIAALPNLTTLRLQDMELGCDSLLILEHTLQAFPEIKKLQLRDVTIKNVDKFDDVIKNCPVERIEFVGCWSSRKLSKWQNIAN